jgi:NAD(P)H-nitrite reductase large subunit
MWGKKRRAGTASRDILHTEDEVLAVIGRALALYKAEGKPRERFGEMLERLGDGAREHIAQGGEKA